MSAAGKFAKLSDPSANAAEVTPSDETSFAQPARGLYVGGAGDVKVGLSGGSVVTFRAVQAGTILPVRACRVYSNGTSATDIVALW